MMTGRVNEHLEGIVRLTLINSRGQRTVISAVVDTGFNGFLTLRPGDVIKLGLKQRGFVRSELADGSAAALRQFVAEIEWNRRRRRVEVLEGDGARLVGMQLMLDHELHVAVRVGGKLAIEPSDAHPRRRRASSIE